MVYVPHFQIVVIDNNNLSTFGLTFLSFSLYSYTLPAKPTALKTSTGLLLAGGALVTWNLINKKSASGTLNFYPESVRQIRFEGVTPVMTIGLAIQNTSNQQYVMRSIAGNLYANNYLVGNVSYFQPQTIRANAQTVILLDARLALIGLVNDIIRAFQYGNFKQDVDFRSFANVDTFQVPIDITYKIG